MFSNDRLAIEAKLRKDSFLSARRLAEQWVLNRLWPNAHGIEQRNWACGVLSALDGFLCNSGKHVPCLLADRLAFLLQCFEGLVFQRFQCDVLPSEPRTCKFYSGFWVYLAGTSLRCPC